MRIVMPVPSSEKTEKYFIREFEEKPIEAYTNKLTKQFIQNRYIVLKNFYDKEIIDITLDGWKTIEHNPELYKIVFENEEETIPDSPKESHNTSKGGYTAPFAVGLHKWTQKKLDILLDLDLVHTYSFSRKYTRGGFLKAHTDRPSCEISGTMCLDYKSDDNTPWTIWVQNKENYGGINYGDIWDISQGKRHNERDGIAINLEVGDLLMYQGPNVIHWRDTFLGDYSYHIFLHFHNGSSKLNPIPSFHPFDETRKSILEYDGRENPYIRSRHPNDDKLLNKFNEDYAKIKVKDLVNNYEQIEFIDDSI